MISIAAEAQNLHGDFRRDRIPLVTVESGERIRFSAPDVAWGLENHQADGGPRAKVVPRSEGPCLVGPVAVRGATPGKVLSIMIEEVRPGPWGWTQAGGVSMFSTDLNTALGVRDERALLRWTLKEGWAISHLGDRLRTYPFPGIIGMPADVEGSQSGWTPRATGGNLDCRHLVAGNRLLLPIEVEGGLLSCGDGHARQADGECGGTAIECPLESLLVQLEVVDEPVRRPTIETPSGWVVLGFGQTLEQASQDALNAALDWMSPRLNLNRAETLAMAGLCCHLQITQVVNGVVGVQAVWEEE